MKRALKVVLAAFGAMGAIAGLFVWDTISRAARAIEENETRLAADIAAYRARHKPGLPLDAAFLTGSAFCAMSLYSTPDAVRPEDGHSGHQAVHAKLLSDYWGISYPPDIPVPESVPPGGAELSALALAFRATRESGFASRQLGWEFEQAALRTLLPVLSAGLPPSDLRRIAGQLDRALDSRPSFRDGLDAEFFMDRAEILRILREKSDPLGFIRRRPGWRELFSWKLLFAKCLGEIDDQYRRVAFEVDAPLPMLTSTIIRSEASMRLAADQLCLAHWSLTRVVAALALFKVEHGRLPARLEELIPAYLPKIPLNPLSGKPIEFLDGTVRTDAPGRPIEWTMVPK